MFLDNCTKFIIAAGKKSFLCCKNSKNCYNIFDYMRYCALLCSFADKKGNDTNG